MAKRASMRSRPGPGLWFPTWAMKLPAGPAKSSIRSTIAASSVALRAARNLFISTGDFGQGITHGALAGLLIRDLIVDGSSTWEDVYDPIEHRRRDPGNYAGENLTAVQNFAEYLLPGRDRVRPTT